MMVSIRSAALVTLMASTAACARETPAPAAARATPVTVVPVASSNTSVPVIATGRFGARDEVPLSFKIGGIVASVSVNEGDRVRKGQRLASLDLREIDALLAKARVAVEKAERDVSRMRRLAADSVVTHTQLQDATSAYDAARADLAAAEVNREYAVIVAPSDGVVSSRTVVAGATVSPGTSVVTISADARGRVLKAGLPDRDIVRVKHGDAATVRFDALPGRTFGAVVSQVSRTADARSGTYVVELSLQGADGLPAGLIGRAEISTSQGMSTTRVPVEALVDATGDTATVFSLQQDSIAVRHRVRVVALYGDEAAIDGLAATEVITRGAAYIVDGERVRVVRPNTTARGSTP